MSRSPGVDAAIGAIGSVAPMTARTGNDVDPESARFDGIPTLGSTVSAVALALVLAVPGVAHFRRPEFFDPIVPHWVPGSARATTYVSGVVELVAAALVAWPRSRRVGAVLAAATFVGVFPANVQAALDGGMSHVDPPFDSAAAAWLRLPLQIPLVVWALKVARRAQPSQR